MIFVGEINFAQCHQTFVLFVGMNAPYLFCLRASCIQSEDKHHYRIDSIIFRLITQREYAFISQITWEFNEYVCVSLLSN